MTLDPSLGSFGARSDGAIAVARNGKTWQRKCIHPRQSGS